MRRLLLPIFLFIFALRCFAVQVTSPNGAVQFQLFHDGPLKFAVTLNGKPVIEKSSLQFSVDGVDLTSGVQPGELQTYKLKETYPWRGVHSVASNHCNGAAFALKHGSTDFILEVRAYDDGVAFRFIAPGATNVLRTPEESSKFILPADSRLWYHGARGHYEGDYGSKNIGEVQSNEWAMPPVTFKLPDGRGYASLTEAALVNYSGAAFQADGANGFNLVLADKQPPSYPYTLRYSTNDVARLSLPAKISGTITTPWRVVMIGDLNTLVNCDIINSLNPPPDPKYFPKGIKTDWLKPGRALWTYLDGGESTIAGQKELCRMAGQLGFQYDVIEGYWNDWSDAEIKDLVAYARQQGVGLWFWEHSRRLQTPEAREDFFKTLHNFGVVGAKIDFFDHEHKEVIDVYNGLLETAAKYQILLNFHGSDKPTGTIRTWPNEMTREAVHGMEARRMQDRATHDTTLPFTRFLAGPADYTPMLFGERRANTTWAHQIADTAVFTMPLLTFGANPSNILTNPAVEIIKNIPATWDETIVLPPSEIGECAVFARRSGDIWFVAALNGTTPRMFSVPLKFLGKGDYKALLAEDSGEGPATLNMEKKTFSRGDSLIINMRNGGGFVARLTKK